MHMSDYSKVNLLEIENSSSDDDIKMRFSRKFIDSRDLGVTLANYAPNFKSKMAHSHGAQEEAYVVVRGSGNILLNAEVVEIKLWDVVRVSPEITRAFEAGPDGLDIIAVGGPKPEGGDGVKHDAEWPKDK
jgi:mannose-6-phosphate isomerase-like protein (cupin superfamily)